MKREKPGGVPKAFRLQTHNAEDTPSDLIYTSLVDRTGLALVAWGTDELAGVSRGLEAGLLYEETATSATCRSNVNDPRWLNLIHLLPFSYATDLENLVSNSLGYG